MLDLALEGEADRQPQRRDHGQAHQAEAPEQGEPRRRLTHDTVIGRDGALVESRQMTSLHATAVLSVECPRATRPTTRRPASARSSRATSPTRSARRTGASRAIAGPSGWPAAPCAGSTPT